MQARQRSMLLEEAAKAIGEWTLNEHARMDESLARRYGATWRSDWSGDVQQRIKYLAQAMAVESSKLFANTIRWTRSGFESRDVPAADLRASLQCMNQVIGENLPPAVSDCAGEYLREAMERMDAEADPAEQFNGTTGVDRTRVSKFMETALTGRRRDAEALLLEAMDRGDSFRDIFTNLLQPSMVEIGRMWHRDEITVADEHAATAVAESAMTVLRARCPIPEPRGRRVVAASVAGELHAMGVRMVADFFELDGWDVLYLGANMPDVDVIHALRSHDAQLLAASVTNLLNLRALGDLIDAVRAQDDLARVKILVGGRPLVDDDSVWRRLGADGCASTAEEAVRLGNQLLDGS